MLVGETYGRLTVMALGEPTKKNRHRPVIVACECGTVKLLKSHYRLPSGNTKSCGCLAFEARSRMGKANRKEEVNSEYLRAHALVRATKGNAKQYKCIGCDKQATEWSYDGGDPDERTEIRADGRPGNKPRLVKFSFSPSRYLARCHSCHVRHDIFSKDYAEGLLWLL